MDIIKSYKPLTIPHLVWERETLTDSYGELIVQPLEPGFGMTIGNALRRALLGAVEGAAVTSVIIKGVNNEFSTIPGVIEDAMQLILNIKQLVIRNKEGKPGTMRLTVTGEGVAKASDIVADGHLEIVNKEHVIAHVAHEGDVDITFFVDSGRGYQIAQWPAEERYQADNRIYIDAMYSPIKRVMFEIEKTRVGQNIDYDRLILRIQTDGSENPVSVLHYAVSVLRTQLEHFLALAEIPFNDISVKPEKKEEKRPASHLDKFGLKPGQLELLLKPIEELELSVRAHNCLKNAGINRIIDLVTIPEDDLLKIKNFGRKSLNEVKESVKVLGLSFGMHISEEEVKRLLESTK